MGRFHDKQFPGESAAYRKARDELLDAEIELRKRIEDIAVLRRGLPPGGELKEDYVFEEGAADLSDQQTVKPVRFSELFEKGKDSLIIYSFMYGPDWNNPCPMCVSILDSLNGNAPPVQQRVNVAVVARAPIEKIRSWALPRGWRNLRLLSSRNNTYNTDYCAENSEDDQIPAINVFRKTNNGIYHFYNSELLYAPTEKGQHMRHADLIWPLWNLFDLIPDGRGTDWLPGLSYD